MIVNEDEFKERCLRRSNSEGSWLAYREPIREFDAEFQPLHEVVEKCKTDPKLIYKVLDSYVGFLTTKKAYAPKTVDRKFAAVKAYLRFLDIEISNETVKQKIVFPRRYIKNTDRAPELEELWTALSKADLRGQTLILGLSSSGMRLAEFLNVRIEDIDFRSHPTRIQIYAETAKERQGREVFISDEATECLKKYLAGRKEGYVFHGYDLSDGTTKFTGAKHANYVANLNKPLNDDTAKSLLRRVFNKAGLEKMSKGGKRHEIHTHTLRKFFYSRMVGVIGEAYTHALMGHKRYLDEYLSLSPEQRAQIYLKGMDSLKVMTHVHEVSSMRTEVEAQKKTVEDEKQKLELEKKVLQRQLSEMRESIVQEVKNEILRLGRIEEATKQKKA
ncbi:MAG: site-specific integrase [Nitrososphaerota archaeon]|nr:site-specific integrase [Nitrososphaerota archaeon]